jgi:microcystin-dependent protein
MNQLRARMGALRAFAVAIALALAPQPGHAAGSIPVALSQQMDANGKPLVGALLYLYVVGTVAQPQLAYQDTGLSLPLPWPVVADANGRLPMFYLADGSIHARLTDAAGSVQFDYPSMLVIGPSGGGGGGSSVDPTTIFSTGDIKFRPTSETLSGWVKVNGQTIGSSLSGASGRANADTQALFIYLWTNCPDAHCPVLSGRGANALADFNANKQLTLPDWRGRQVAGLDDMGGAAGGFYAGVPFSGADTATTPGGFAGENTHTLVTAEIPAHNHALTDPGHSHNFAGGGAPLTNAGNNNAFQAGPSGSFTSMSSAVTGITMANTGGGTAHNNVSRVTLGTWYMRL